MNEDKKGSAVDEFFKALPEEDKKIANVFDEKKDGEEPKVLSEKEKQDIDPETTPESLKDRRHRRLEQKLQSERESNIALNERLKAVTETKRVSQDEGVDERLLSIFGTTDVGKEIAQKFSGILAEYKQSAKEEAVSQLEEYQSQNEAEEAKFEDYIDSQLETIEDTYNVDLTSNTASANKAREEFLTLIERLSPKDAQGNLEAYADFPSTFEIYRNSKLNVGNATRQKEIAAKSMQRSQTSERTQESTPGFRGWEKDYNITN